MFDTTKIYTRKDLHKQYGGNGWGGIAPCASHPMIMIFSGESGEQYGYEDRWDFDNYFLYTGEGQVGDMVFKRGNLAIRHHEKNKKKVYLFEYVSSGKVQFKNELQLVDNFYFQCDDINGDSRKGIKFKFRLAALDSTPVASGIIAHNYNKPDKTERECLITSRVGQGSYRNELVERWNGKCAVLKCGILPILIASHIVSWKESTDEERLDVDNGILLSPNLDSLFDRHFISFADKGSIIISNILDQEMLNLLGIKSDMIIIGLTAGNKKYLKRHRTKLLTKENNLSKS